MIASQHALRCIHRIVHAHRVDQIRPIAVDRVAVLALYRERADQTGIDLMRRLIRAKGAEEPDDEVIPNRLRRRC